MKKTTIILSAVSLLITLLFSCGESYEQVTIGEQVWIAENLNVSKFRNGDPIPHAKTDEEWKRAIENGEPAWCYFDNDPANGEKYGKLYNWHAVNDLRGLAPEGWKIPSDKDWSELIDYLGGKETAGAKMKTNSDWKYNDWAKGTNESGFSGLPGGARDGSGEFYGVGSSGVWWSANEYIEIFVRINSQGRVKLLNLSYSSDDVYLGVGNLSKDRGLSVRCLKETDYSESATFNKDVSKEEAELKEVKISNQVWMAQNLNISKFRNGDPILHAKTAEEWRKASEDKEAAWCYYDNNPANGEKYGKLYNWYAVNDPRGLAPEGWKIPSDDDWGMLIDSLGGKEVAGTKMKSTSGWMDDGNGTNESGFSGVPGGFRYDVVFYRAESNGYWWSSTEYDSAESNDYWLSSSEDDSSFAWRLLLSGDSRTRRGTENKKCGFAVRCLRKTD